VTGDESPDTKGPVEQHLFPLLRDRGVRFAQVARLGREEKDGWAVLSDTRQPRELHVRGRHRLSDEMRHAGTLPQCSTRRCSCKFKG